MADDDYQLSDEACRHPPAPPRPMDQENGVSINLAADPTPIEKFMGALELLEWVNVGVPLIDWFDHPAALADALARLLQLASFLSDAADNAITRATAGRTPVEAR